MGIGYHELNFLNYAARQQPFGATATIGRQNIFVSDHAIRKITGAHEGKPYGPFCEELLTEHMGATVVHSFDKSSYEGATFEHDFNRPLRHDRQYDTVMDFGTLEHVFDVAMALKNVASLCQHGGQILHALPANNLNGHGFWQFSPELFFSLYSAANDFSETEVFVAELNDAEHWYRASRPSGGIRVEYTSPFQSYLLVRTRKMAEHVVESVQQSDYISAWDEGSPRPSPRADGEGLSAWIRHLPLVWRAFRLIDNATSARSRRLAGNNQFAKVLISALRE
jgi:hypothetical protein